MGTIHELELIDSAARAQQALDGELVGERMILNMGPSHPSTHGVFRLVLELDGEEIVNCWPEIGYLHRAFEKMCETVMYTQCFPYTDRLNYVSPLVNKYIVAIVNSLRTDPDMLSGSSTRASIALFKCARVLALFDGRDFVIPDDVKRLVYPALEHRIKVKPEAEMDDVTPRMLLDRTLEKIAVPKI